mmetsp:Transcript_22317/g.51708  ORF Transcript_22317/g.51708 Transcript_22317/m.51708 type:complete len:207 (+) Transcript_22317:927-1547(+)
MWVSRSYWTTALCAKRPKTVVEILCQCDWRLPKWCAFRMAPRGWSTARLGCGFATRCSLAMSGTSSTQTPNLAVPLQHPSSEWAQNPQAAQLQTREVILLVTVGIPSECSPTCSRALWTASSSKTFWANPIQAPTSSGFFMVHLQLLSNIFPIKSFAWTKQAATGERYMARASTSRSVSRRQTSTAKKTPMGIVGCYFVGSRWAKS